MNTPSQTEAIEQIIAKFSQFVVARINAFRYRDYGLDQGDLAQDIFIRIWEYYDKSDKNIADLKSYICKIVNSVVIDAIKKSRKEGDALRKLGGVTLAQQNRSGPKREEANDTLRAVVLGTLSQIKSSRRKVIRLYLSGLTLDEITDLMRWKKSKTNNLFYRGLDDLRTRLAAKDVDYEN